MKNLILLIVFITCQCVAASCCSAQDKNAKGDIESKISAISKTIETVMKLHKVPAVSACIVTPKGSSFINHGTLSLNSEKNVDERSIYQIASLSKTFAGLVAHEMVRNGTIKLSDSISDYLPENISEATRRKVQPISMLDLICHRSGLPRDTLNPKARRNDTYVNYEYNEADMLQDLEKMRLDFEPGERFMYSNYGYSLLAYLLERASGKDYSQLVQEIVTTPNGMSDSGFEIEQVQGQRLVTPYDHKTPKVAREPARIGKLGPPTSLYSTTADLAKLMKKQVAEYHQYIETDQVSLMVLTQHANEAWEGSGIQYGFGFFDWGDGTFGHSGGMDGYGSEYTFDPQSERGFILLTSSVESWTQRLTIAVNKVMNDGRTEVLDELVAVERIVATFESRGPEAALKAYQRLRKKKRSPLGEESRVTLVNLALQKGLSDAATLFARDAVTDFPQSTRIKKLSEAVQGR